MLAVTTAKKFSRFFFYIRKEILTTYCDIGLKMYNIQLLLLNILLGETSFKSKTL